jgi:hypothetical protein
MLSAVQAFRLSGSCRHVAWALRLVSSVTVCADTYSNSAQGLFGHEKLRKHQDWDTIAQNAIQECAAADASLQAVSHCLHVDGLHS